MAGSTKRWGVLVIAAAVLATTAAVPTSPVHGGEVDVAAVPLVPAGATRFVPLAPVRFLDTRETSDITAGAPVPQGGSIDLQITGRLGVPSSGVDAVVLNLTAVDALAPGFVTVWPTGKPRPVAANLNVTEVGQNIGNLVTVRVGAGGKISLFSQTGTHFVADVAGYYAPVAAATTAGRYQALSPSRLLDTREALGTPTTTVVPPGGTVDVAVAGRGGVPTTGVGAVVLSVAAADATAPGFVTVWPTGVVRPLAASLNVTFAGQNIQNAVIVPLGTDGKISLFSQSGTHLVVDVSGWFGDTTQPATIDGLFVPVTPVRILDTREANGVPGIFPVAPGGSIDVAVTGAGGVPTSGVTAAVINLTAAAATAPGFVSVWPTGQARPLVASVNVTAAGQNIGSLVTATLGAGGKISLFTQSGTHLIADLAGYYTNVASPPGGKLAVTAYVVGAGGVPFPPGKAAVIACPAVDSTTPADCSNSHFQWDQDGDAAVTLTVDPNQLYQLGGAAVNQPWCPAFIAPDGTKWNFANQVVFLRGAEIEGRAVVIRDPSA